jgi:putative ABC transport system permease protein
VEQAIDRQFANSLNETLTQSEQELVQSQVENLGDLDVAVHRVTAATFFVLLFATGALMMQSIRERTPELAVLKTVGYSSPLVMTLILAETLMLCVTGAALGLWIASRLLPLASSFTGLGSIPAIVIETGLACAVILALAAGSIPAWRGLRLRAVDALANR